MHRAEVWCLEVCREMLVIGSNRLSKFKLQPSSQEDKVSLRDVSVLVIAQHECNMPYCTGAAGPRALCHSVQYLACCTRAPAITNLLPNDVRLVKFFLFPYKKKKKRESEFC